MYAEVNMIAATATAPAATQGNQRWRAFEGAADSTPAGGISEMSCICSLRSCAFWFDKLQRSCGLIRHAKRYDA